MNKKEIIITTVLIALVVIALAFMTKDNSGNSLEVNKSINTASKTKIKENITDNENLSLDIVNWDWHRSGDYIYINGSVKNNSDKSISYYEVLAKFLDDSNSVLDSDYTNDGMSLKPNEQKEFEIMHKFNPSYSDMVLSIENVKYE